MKKLSLALSIVLMMCIMVACGSGEPATIIDNEGNTVQMTADELKEYVQDEGAGDYTAIHAWSKDSNYTYLYLEYQQPGSIWMKVDMSEDGKTFTAHNPDSLNIPDGTEPLLDDYDAVQDVINLYLYM